MKIAGEGTVGNLWRLGLTKGEPLHGKSAEMPHLSKQAKCGMVASQWLEPRAPDGSCQSS